jgi:AraC-like DNA-binding protein
MRQTTQSRQLAPSRRPGPADAADSSGEVSHDGLLVFAHAGMMSVTVAGSLWALAPHRALWVPPGTPYLLHHRKNVDAQLLRLRPTTDLPSLPRLVEVTPLMRELILEAARLAEAAQNSDEATWVDHLLRSRIRAAPVPASRICAPSDPRLKQICDAIIGDPSDNRTIDYWADRIGMSRRTLTRRFRDEIGTSFSLWRQQVRLQEALVRLEMGEPITTIALDVGYEWPNSFSTVFRQTFGAPPSRFVNPAA